MFPVLSTQKRTLRTTPGRNGQRRFSKSASLLTQLLGSTRIDFNRNPSQADVPPFLGLPVRNLFVHSYTSRYVLMTCITLTSTGIVPSQSYHVHRLAADKHLKDSQIAAEAFKVLSDNHLTNGGQTTHLLFGHHQISSSIMNAETTDSLREILQVRFQRRRGLNNLVG